MSVILSSPFTKSLNETSIISLEGFGKTEFTVEALVTESLSFGLILGMDFLQEHEARILLNKNVVELDINPLILNEKKAYVVDARIVLEK